MKIPGVFGYMEKSPESISSKVIKLELEKEVVLRHLNNLDLQKKRQTMARINYMEGRMKKHLKNIQRWGGFLIIVGALLPIPFSMTSMAAGTINYRFRNYYRGFDGRRSIKRRSKNPSRIQNRRV